MSTTTPVYTANTAGNIDASASLGAAGTRTANYDGTMKYETQVHVKNTPGGSVHATRGLRVDVYRRYGSSPTTGQSPFLTYTMPSASAGTAESIDFFLGPGNYAITLTNLDGTNAITVEVTGDTVSSVSTV